MGLQIERGKEGRGLPLFHLFSPALEFQPFPSFLGLSLSLSLSRKEDTTKVGWREKWKQTSTGMEIDNTFYIKKVIFFKKSKLLL